MARTTPPSPSTLHLDAGSVPCPVPEGSQLRTSRKGSVSTCRRFCRPPDAGSATTALRAGRQERGQPERAEPPESLIIHAGTVGGGGGSASFHHSFSSQRTIPQAVAVAPGLDISWRPPWHPVCSPSF